MRIVVKVVSIYPLVTHKYKLDLANTILNTLSNYSFLKEPKIEWITFRGFREELPMLLRLLGVKIIYFTHTSLAEVSSRRGALAGYILAARRLAVQRYYFNIVGLEEAIFILAEGLDFYVWLIPKADKLVVGHLNEHQEQADRVMPWALEALGYDTKGFGELLARRGRTAILLKSLSQLVLVHNDVLVAGEAAGLITRNWGEGIYPALVSGELAARNYSDPEGYRRMVAEKLLSFRREV